MKILGLALLLATSVALADDNCRVTTVSSEHGAKFENETITVCKEGDVPAQKIKIGDTILEMEVGRSKIDHYFMHNNAKCRMFTERLAVKGRLRVYHGVICQVDNSPTNWIVLDKW